MVDGRGWWVGKGLCDGGGVAVWVLGAEGERAGEEFSEASVTKKREINYIANERPSTTTEACALLVLGFALGLLYCGHALLWLLYKWRPVYIH